MKALLTIILTVSALVSASGGTITGRVRAEGKTGADSDANCGKYDSPQLKFAEKVDYDSIHDFIVYIDQPVGTNAPVAPDKPVQVLTTKKQVSQKGAMFNPHVLPIVVGTTVEWPNKDDIFHNVYSDSEVTNFDLGLYKDPEVKRVTFNTPGRVDIFCSIHSSMSCVVLVLRNPYYATTDRKGVYKITNVPAGTYKLKAWHERLPSNRKTITVPENGEVTVDFALGVKNLPKL
jgi:plastocyanin